MARKISGGRYKQIRKKKLFEMPGRERAAKLGKEKKKSIRIRGGKIKTVLLATDKANILDPKTKKSKVVAIKNVLETPANKFLARQNLLIKGAIIETELGKARITNRPSQESFVNAILIEETKIA
jgi:small subunit ribosomal protein S8e